MTSNSQKKRPTTPKEDYYKILGVSRTATDEEIKQAYRRLALQYHPDKNPDPEATARFQEINKANKVLGNPRSRSAYDLLGSQAADMMDQYDDYPGTYRQMSGCKKVLFALFCCLSGCGCCCCCFFCFCGCCCCNVFCCNRCCNHCCGLCGDPSVANESEEQQSDYIHRQPTNNNRDSTRY